MKLGIQLLDSSSTLNSLRKITEQTIRQGETTDVYFQLVDGEQANLRYIPGSGSTAFVEIPRFTEALPTILNQRDVKDYSVRQFAVNPFPGDLSVWKLPLTSVQTKNMMSSGMRVTITDGAVIKIAYLTLAFRVYRGEA
jgi:hypothetical protein